MLYFYKIADWFSILSYNLCSYTGTSRSLLPEEIIQRAQNVKEKGLEEVLVLFPLLLVD